MSQSTNSEQELKSPKGAVLDLKWNPQMHEIEEEEEEEEEEKYEPQLEGKAASMGKPFEVPGTASS